MTEELKIGKIEFNDPLRREASEAKLDLGSCGCGKPNRYGVGNGEMACNKHFRCMTYEQMFQRVVSLNAELARLRAEIEKRDDLLRKATRIEFDRAEIRIGADDEGRWWVMDGTKYVSTPYGSPLDAFAALESTDSASPAPDPRG